MTIEQWDRELEKALEAGDEEKAQALLRTAMFNLDQFAQCETTDGD